MSFSICWSRGARVSCAREASRSQRCVNYHEEQNLNALQVQRLVGGVDDKHVEAEKLVQVPVVQRDAELRKIVQEVPQRSGCFLRLLLVMNGVSRSRCRGIMCMLIQEYSVVPVEHALGVLRGLVGRVLEAQLLYEGVGEARVEMPLGAEALVP